VRKEYIARVLGRFSEYVGCVRSCHQRVSAHIPLLFRQEVTCEEPLLTVDRQIGLNIVHPDGKVC
jgi:hypothetical protein